MQQKQRRRLLAVLLFLALALSFLWCIVDDIVTSAEATKTGYATPVTAVTITGGILWLVGHGIHGAAVVGIPVLLSRRSGEKERLHGYY